MRLIALILGFLFSVETAGAFECTGVKLPSSIVICSDPELIRVADERQEAFNEARARLSEQQFKDLIADQTAWVRSYATACGVPPDGGQSVLPVSLSIKTCFKRAGEARTAYIRSYGLQAGTTPSSAPATPIAQNRIGPGFDCAKAKPPLALMICSDPELARIDLAFNQAYWALYQQVADDARRQLKEDDVRFVEGVQDRCGVPRSGGLSADIWQSRSCIKQAFEQQRAQWIGRLSGPAHEEAMRPLGAHIALERSLRQLGFLPAASVPEGVYGVATRRGIIAWQQSRGRTPTGFLDDFDALALQREAMPQPQPPLEQANKRDDIPHEPPSAPNPPPKPSKGLSLGTAFAINSAGDFLTNYHVIKGCGGVVRVQVSAGGAEGRVIASDERNDLAVIRIRGAGIEPVRLREGKGIRPADGVVALGFPYAGLLASSPQVTAGAVSALAGLMDDSRYLQFTAPVQPGNSGGPLFDLSGNVVGMVSGRINDLAVAEATGSLPQNINFAIKTGIVREFLEANRIIYLTGPSDIKLEPADVAERATKSIVLVGCRN